TTSALAHADSSPRKAHSVMALEEPTAAKTGTWCGFQELTYSVGLNQNEPMMHIPTTGIMTPQTVILLTSPVQRATPKLATVQIHTTPMVASPICTGVSATPNSSVP